MGFQSLGIMSHLQARSASCGLRDLVFLTHKRASWRMAALYFVACTEKEIAMLHRRLALQAKAAVHSVRPQRCRLRTLVRAPLQPFSEILLFEKVSSIRLICRHVLHRRFIF